MTSPLFNIWRVISPIRDIFASKIGRWSLCIGLAYFPHLAKRLNGGDYGVVSRGLEKFIWPMCSLSTPSIRPNMALTLPLSFLPTICTAPSIQAS